MSRWKITVEYDGSGFCGWQRQAQDISVQQTLEDAIYKFSGENVTLHVAGRTDTGVHALANVAHFDLVRETDAETVRDAVNFHVRPHKVTVREAEAVNEEFHARFSAQARRYRYQIINRRAPPALLADHTWHVSRPLAVEPIQAAAHLLIGHHDFSTFRAQNCQANSPLRTLDSLQITRDNEMIVFEIRARSFLYHQVRNMVGTLTMVGSGQWTLEDFQTAFAACNRSKGGPTAPPQGLFFVGVEYP